MTDHDLRRYMHLAAKAQAGDIDLISLLELCALHLRIKLARRNWLKDVNE